MDCQALGSGVLGTPELGPVRRAIELILEHHEPYPVLVIDSW
jgi:hypothetical protein